MTAHFVTAPFSGGHFGLCFDVLCHRHGTDGNDASQVFAGVHEASADDRLPRFLLHLFLLISRALNDLNLGLAYATWSGVGIVASVLISWFLFGEKLNGWGIFAVAMIIIGCIILNVFGTDH